QVHELINGDLKQIDAPFQPVQARLSPHKNMDIGAGKGEEINTTIYGGVVGLIFDGRGRPLVLPENDTERIEKLQLWSKTVNEYPKFS
ncbi:MAG: methylaspartate mutase, partial [Candidatus Neomarinimicrobiota bacterium]